MVKIKNDSTIKYLNSLFNYENNKQIKEQLVLQIILEPSDAEAHTGLHCHEVFLDGHIYALRHSLSESVTGMIGADKARKSTTYVLGTRDRTVEGDILCFLRKRRDWTLREA